MPKHKNNNNKFGLLSLSGDNPKLAKGKSKKNKKTKKSNKEKDAGKKSKKKGIR